MSRLWYFIFIASLCCPNVGTADAVIQNIIRNRIEAAGIPLNISVAGEPIHATVVLPRFYERRAYRPAWSKNHRPSP